MPRPKVLPENRKRSVQACVPCRNSKVRCDAQQPCQGCRKRGKIEACIFDAPYHHSHPSRASTNSREDPGSAFTEASLTSPVDVPDAEAGTEHSTNDAGSSDETWQPGSHKTRSRMLFSSKGEQLYLGGTASISYLQFLRQVLKRHAGPSAFTESGVNNVMLEVDPSPYGNIDEIGRLDVEHQKALIQCYFEATSAILDLFSSDEIYTALSFENIIGGDRKQDRRATQAIFHMVLAIGGQCRGIYPNDTKFAAHYFYKAQQFAFEGFLCDPSLNMIKLFLLMAFYMLGACRRNAAFMYLGVASKAANALGLHRKDQYRVLPKADGAERLRTWKSLCVLDTIVSSILGRPGNFSSVWHDDLESSSDNDRDSRSSSLAIDATYEMSCLVDSMESRLWSSKSVECQPAEDFLHELRKWSQKLPPELRRFSSDNMFVSSPADRELLVGAAHVACVYYFAVILVTRPFLTSHIMLKLRDRARKSHNHAVADSSASIERAKVANLAQVCVESATYMAIMAHRAMEAGILLRNMCLMK
ncbi:hypothetical protein EJ05DRAFT_453212 [Pseudovirgaria hyperparasitica]|uniref:Zn(2)-C6 fungal-type domain-containing protein n=1 Tax=Pseudovirgaria hyperparasitica TaxID=470096 RepID=A0A6A6W5W1_9PEZI|nr:uncharacterized protein EJ05DRAFT_453212 [Pseudovirgaria hyperparasitica]KAF2757414.1 hypothetical protein EJ05DRAFT_453212 [Pseudovirgaria hyperparasitica]